MTQRVFEFPQFRVRGILSVELKQPLEQIRERKKCRVFTIRGTPTFPSGMELLGDILFEHLHQSGLSDTSITTQ